MATFNTIDHNLILLQLSSRYGGWRGGAFSPRILNGYETVKKTLKNLKYIQTLKLLCFFRSLAKTYGNQLH